MIRRGFDAICVCPLIDHGQQPMKMPTEVTLYNVFNVDLLFYFVPGPDARYTHWKQTVFYLNDYLTVKHGELLNGKFALMQNPRNNVSLLIFPRSGILI